ncbi:MAG: hypothetical protein K8I27_04720 [Planctomycetes bacterium]|nr:hypothetical protein [Planctomycetota bacterium]
MKDDLRTAVRSALMLLREHARQRLSQYATRHRMRPTGWHFMIDASSGAGGKLTESGLVLMKTSGTLYFAIRISIASDGLNKLPDASTLEILQLDEARVAHLIFSRDGWTETRAVKKQSDKIVENAMPAPDQLDDA